MNITLSLDEELLKKSREYARLHHTSLNHMVREILKEKVENRSSGWLEEAFGIMDGMKVKRTGTAWKREDLYRCCIRKI
jgi:plasmid stability protein